MVARVCAHVCMCVEAYRSNVNGGFLRGWDFQALSLYKSYIVVTFYFLKPKKHIMFL